MFTIEQVDETMDVARDALVLLAELVANGQRGRGEAYLRAQAEHDALVSLLDEAPESEQPRIHGLLDRYDAFLASLVN